MSAEEDFLHRELAWVRQVRATRNTSLLHLVEPAVAREREIFRRLGEIQSNDSGAVAVCFAERDRDPGAPDDKEGREQ